jgi:hypothetical protein
MDRVLRPVRWEDLAEVHLVEVGAEVVELHPPVAVVLESVLQFLLQSLVVVPRLVLISELASPLALPPRISDSNQLEAVDVPDLLDSESVVVNDSGVAHAFFSIAILVFHGLGATK